MDLLKICSEPTGLEILVVIIGVLILFSAFMFIFVWDDKSKKQIIVNIVMYFVALVIIYFGACMTNDIVYYYSVDDVTKVQDMLDSGYNLESTDAERYSFTKVQ